MTREAHGQQAARVRFDWGPTGAAAVAAGADVAVVVDVLSFTTTLTVAVDRGITVYPYRWRDDRAQAYADERGAVLAAGRLEGLSPAAMRSADGLDRVVLPSPNGSAISFGLAESGATVVGASLRNATAVGRWLALRVADGATVAVVAAGERWPDASLRPAVEDLWGAGAVLSALSVLPLGPREGFSPEASLAAAAFRAVEELLAEELRGCASGQELVAAGFGADVTIAAELDSSLVVPMLDGEAFVRGA